MSSPVNAKISLRPLALSDADSLALYLNNRKIWNNLRDALPRPYTREDAVRFITTQQNDASLTCFGIVLDEALIGNVGFTRGSDIERFTAEVGYFLGEPFWGQGIMSEALGRAVNQYFATTDVVRLFATTFAPNKASARVLEKVGFELKCMLSKGAFKNGRFIDTLYYENIIKQT